MRLETFIFMMCIWQRHWETAAAWAERVKVGAPKGCIPLF